MFGSTGFPCYCCGKEIKNSPVFHVVTHDGCRFMNHEEWVKLCASNGNNAADPNDALGSCGIDWRPETFGPACYRKHKSMFKGKCVEVKAPSGEYFLFVNER
jgi:hypothetical protein